MFKRQFYALEHAHGGGPASSSSSSSLATASDGEGVDDVSDDGASRSTASHESDAYSEVELEAVGDISGGRLDNISDISRGNISDGSVKESYDDDDNDISDAEPRVIQPLRKLSNQWAEAVDDDESERILDKYEGSSVIRVGARNRVSKCRLCPKVVCLSEKSLESHLKSKGHARSLKQLANGSLKVQLDSDGEEEEEGETHAERFARTVTRAEEEVKPPPKSRSSGRQRQRQRIKRKAILAKERKSGTLLSPAMSKPVDKGNMLKKRKSVKASDPHVSDLSPVRNGDASKIGQNKRGD